MSAPSTTLRQLTSVLGEMTHPSASRHPDLEELLDYASDGLGPERTEEIQSHLLGCAECTRQLIELDALRCAETPEVPSLEMERAWRDFEGRLRPPSATHAEASPSTVWLRIAAAVLLVSNVALATWLLQERGESLAAREQLAELARPVTNPSTAVLQGPTRGDSDNTLNLSESGAWFSLSVVLPLDVQSSDKYHVVVENDRGPIFETGSAVAANGGVLELLMPTTLFERGTHRVRVRSSSTSTEHTYRLDVVER